MQNAHGDVTGIQGAGGNVAATYDYDAFGNVLSETGTANNSTKYAGHQYDKKSGLYYLNARYYDSVTARFMSGDTYRGQRNDPLVSGMGLHTQQDYYTHVTENQVTEKHNNTYNDKLHMILLMAHGLTSTRKNLLLKV